MSPRDLPTAPPSATGLDATALLRLVREWEATDGLEPHALAVVHRGALVARATWAPYMPDEDRLVYSVSKTVTACALGLLVGDGAVDLDARVVDLLPHLVGPRTVPEWSAVTLRHCAAMATGHAEDAVAAAWAADPDPVRGFLTVAPALAPGSRFVYDQPATQVLAAVVEHVAGEGLLDLVRRRLLRPLGAGEGAWSRDPTGRALGFSGFRCTVDDLARLGLLLVRDGRHDGADVLPPGWVDEVVRMQVATDDHDDPAGPDWLLGYGLQVWRSRHGWRADGAYGQFVLVVPEHDLVVALTGQTERTQRLLDLVWEHVVPAAVAPAPGSPRPGRPDDADEALAAHLSRVTLPDGRARGGAVRPALPAEGVGLDPTGPLPGVRVHLAPAGDAAVRCTLLDGGRDGDDELVVVADDGWSRHPAGTGAVAATLLSADAGRVEVELRPTHLPHALVLDADLVRGTAALRFSTEPLSPVPLTLAGVLRPDGA
ncbi:serine hydrolase domain-containing protein [Aquipuribacter sp. SD81]|uniref:serine hydrolase domain-containing protein n=1 Tax=Aquipuribacter sp. SD81 TaxID=3127703 RepID=UPI00301888B4